MNENLPTREAFVEYWSKRPKPLLCALNLLVYLGVLIGMLYLVSASNSTLQSIAIAVAGAVFAVATPVLYCLTIWRRDDRFLRCPHCRVWIGRDMVGEPGKQHPDWQRTVITRDCTDCGKQVIQPEPTSYPV